MSKRRAKGEGTIRKRVDGRWESRLTLGYSTRTGKVIQKCFYGKTQAEVVEKLHKAMAAHRGPPIGHNEKYTVAGWLRVWFATYSEPYLKMSTAEGYRNHIENHLIPGLGRIWLSQLTTNQIQQFYNEEQKVGRRQNLKDGSSKPLSSSMMRSMHMVLQMALQKAVRLRIINYNPADECKLPKKIYKEMKTLPMSAVGAYLAEAERMGYLAIFYLEFTSGLRRGELCALNFADLNQETRVLGVNKSAMRRNGKTFISLPKTENSIRYVMLPQKTVDLIVEHHKRFGDNPIMFPSMITGDYIDPNRLYRVHSQILKNIGVEHIRFHDLRHTFSTYAIENGVDLKTLSNNLGHYSSSFTLDTYTHTTRKMQEDAADKVGSFIEASRQNSI